MGTARAELTLVIGAMPSELVPIRARLQGARAGRLAGFPYEAGRVGGRRVVTVVCGGRSTTRPAA